MINAKNTAPKTAPIAMPALAPVERSFDEVNVLFPVAAAVVVKLVGENEDTDSEPGAVVAAPFVVAVVGCVTPWVVIPVVGLAELLDISLVLDDATVVGVFEVVDCIAVWESEVNHGMVLAEARSPKWKRLDSSLQHAVLVDVEGLAQQKLPVEFGKHGITFVEPPSDSILIELARKLGR
jgi:hypothetical protein